MTDAVYTIVEHDGGWAYKLGDVFSETFPDRRSAEAAADRVAAEQRVPGDTEAISWEDASGRWHDELESGTDRPNAYVQGESQAAPRPSNQSAGAGPSMQQPAALAPRSKGSSPAFTTLVVAGCVGLLLATLATKSRPAKREE
jgi:hypothetical protein